MWLIGAWICLAVAAGAWAAEPEHDQHVHITADRLLADMDGRTAEFLGNVRAVQGTTVITAARLKVFYAPGSAAGSAAAEQEAIERIEASGEVNIHMEDRTAQADEAVYTTADGILVLTGKQARLTSGANTVVGGRITLNRNANRITVEKASDGRVEAVFISDDKVL